MPIPASSKRKRRALRNERAPNFYRGHAKFTAAEIKEALRINFGNAGMAAESLNEAERKAGGTRTVTRENIRYHIKARGWEEIVVEHGRDALRDLAEHQIIQAIRAGDTRSARWAIDRIDMIRGVLPGNTSAQPLLLDPSVLTIEQLIQIFDPQRLTDAQLDAVFAHLQARFESMMPVIEHMPAEHDNPEDGPGTIENASETAK